MRKRTLTAIALTLVCVPVLLLSEYVVYPIFLALLSLVAVFEVLRCIGYDKNYLISIPAYVISAALPVICYFMGSEKTASFMLIATTLYFILMMYYFTLAVFARGALKFSEIATALVLSVYVSVSFTALCALRYIPNGVYTFVIVFIGAWSCDTFAYIFGSLFGKHKLIEEISPKKTVEGSVAGIVCAILILLLYGLIIDLATDTVKPNYIALAVSGLVISVVSQIGDLVASLIKRERGIKDYGSLFPGHGGVMDRFDSILAVSMPFLLVCSVFPMFN